MTEVTITANGRSYIPGRGTGSPVPIEDRFWLHVDQTTGPDGCWPWMGVTKKPDGYGLVRVDRKYRTTHRVSMELTLGRALSSDEHVCHHCDNPPCVNPTHLFVGTHADNVRDMNAKGRAHVPPRRTHCIHGHSWADPANVARDNRGGRYCLECARINARARRARAKGRR